MYVPDPGLRTKLENLLRISGDIYMDIKICCSDGSFHWNSLLLAAASKHLKVIMTDSIENEDSAIILPDFRCSIVHSLFWKLVDYSGERFSGQECSLLDKLGIITNAEKEPEMKVVHILSSSNSKQPYRNEISCDESSFMSLNQGDEDDVDIIFEQSESDEEMEDNTKTNMGITEEILIETQEEAIPEINLRMETEPTRLVDSVFSSIYNVKEEKEKEEDDANDEELEALQQKMLEMKNLKNKPFICNYCKHRFDHAEYEEHKRARPNHFKVRNKAQTNPDWFCRLCNLDYSMKGSIEFRKHVATHKNAAGKFVCPQCDKTSNTWGHLKQHMYTHGGRELPFKCMYCDYGSINRANIIKHEKSKHEDPNKREFSCYECGKKFKTACNLAQHSKTHSEIRFACKICIKRFKSEKGLTQHMREHSGSKIPCGVCGEAFLSVQSCKRHEKEVHSYHREVEGPKKFLCKTDQCTMEFTTEEEKKVHSNSYHLLKCDLCKFITNNKILIRVHRKECDGKRRPGKSLLRAEDHSGRIKIKHNPVVTSKSFNLCEEKVTTIAGDLPQDDLCRTEIIVESLEESPVEIYSSQQDDINSYFYDICKICKKIFVNFTEYVDHIKGEHSDDISEQTEVDCNICSKTVGLFQLDDHLKICHSYGSLFKCEPCNKTFSELKEFEKHNDDFHDQCHGFSWSSSSEHFTCTYCIKAFKTKTGVVRHINNVHQQQQGNKYKYSMQVGNIDELLNQQQQIVVSEAEVSFEA